LENAVRETGYSSETFNHAYTLALYQAGDRNRLANAAFSIGDFLFETNPGLAMDYFQRALLGGLDAACVRHIGEIFEAWAGPRPERDPSAAAGKPIRKVAHVVGSLARDHEQAQHVNMLAKSLRQEGVHSLIFTTEWDAAWFFNPACEPVSPPSNQPDIVIASVEGDFNERASRVAAAIRASGVQAAFYHGGLSEQITMRVATHRPASVQVNVGYGAEMDASIFDGYIYLTKQGFELTHHPEAAVWIRPASNIEELLQGCPPNLRQLMALESAETVSATLGDLKHASDPGFLRVLADLLRNSPKHFHLFAGPGDVKPVRGCLHAEEVLPQVRFMGSMSESASVLAVTDVYLSPFLDSADGPILDAMGAGKPAVVFENSRCAELLGIPELTARNEGDYAQIAQRLIRDKAERERCAGMVLSRFRQEFDPALLGPRYMQFLRKILQELR
jgi:hypothetical protein